MGQPAVVHERTGRLAGWAAGDGSILEDVESHGAALRTRFGSRVIGWSSLAARPGRTNMEETRAAMKQVVEGRCSEVLAGCVLDRSTRQPRRRSIARESRVYYGRSH
jgi:hypothetical protein